MQLSDNTKCIGFSYARQQQPLSSCDCRNKHVVGPVLEKIADVTV